MKLKGQKAEGGRRKVNAVAAYCLLRPPTLSFAGGMTN
jgi:hypothetical protein